MRLPSKEKTFQPNTGYHICNAKFQIPMPENAVLSLDIFEEFINNNDAMLTEIKLLSLPLPSPDEDESTISE